VVIGATDSLILFVASTLGFLQTVQTQKKIDIQQHVVAYMLLTLTDLR